MTYIPTVNHQTNVINPSPSVSSPVPSIPSYNTLSSPHGTNCNSSNTTHYIPHLAVSNSVATTEKNSFVMAQVSPVPFEDIATVQSGSQYVSTEPGRNSLRSASLSGTNDAFSTASRHVSSFEAKKESFDLPVKSNCGEASKAVEASIPEETNCLWSQEVAMDEAEAKEAQKRWKSRVMLIGKSLAFWAPSPNMPSCANDSSVIPEPKPPNEDEGKNLLTETNAEEKPLCNVEVETANNEEKFVFDSDQDAALNAARAGESFFLTGSAGTGKSFVLKRIIRDLRGRGLNVVVTASTGCAAVAIQGCTIHSASGVGLGMDSISKLRRKALYREVQRKLVSVDVLIIDEISMLDSIIFDKIEAMYSTARGAVSNLPPSYTRRSRRTMSAKEPFGGVQVILCGDFFQLPPVAASDPKLQHLKQKFFAFESEAWKRAITRTIVLSRVHRQADRNFVGLLNEIRFGVVSLKTMRVLSACRMAGREIEVDDKGQYVHYTKLFAFRNQVTMENEKHLTCLQGRAVAYPAKKEVKRELLGMLPIGTVMTMLKSTPGVERLVLKVGARVLCVKNLDQSGGVVNGSAGVVIGFTIPKKIMVQRRLDEVEKKDSKSSHEKPVKDENDEQEMMEQKKKQDEVVTNDGLMQDEVVSLDDERLEKLLSKCPVGWDGIIELDCEFSEVMPVVRFDNGMTRTMYNTAWDIYGMQGVPVAHLFQIPLALGWAMTIHKSQGMTLDRVETDVGRAFDYGQVYVAMSRAKSMQGLRLTTFNASKVMTHEKVIQFYIDSKKSGKKQKKLFESEEKSDIVDGSPMKKIAI